MESLINAINSATTREEVKQILESNCKTKKDLITLAKEIKVYIPQTATKEDIIKRITEHTIGTKLRIEAVRTLSLY